MWVWCGSVEDPSASMKQRIINQCYCKEMVDMIDLLGLQRRERIPTSTCRLPMPKWWDKVLLEWALKLERTPTFVAPKGMPRRSANAPVPFTIICTILMTVIWEAPMFVIWLWCICRAKSWRDSKSASGMKRDATHKICCKDSWLDRIWELSAIESNTREAERLYKLLRDTTWCQSSCDERDRYINHINSIGSKIRAGNT